MDKIQQSSFDFNAQPIKLCECGCGSPAPISKVNWQAKGYIKGQPLRYIAGHQVRTARIALTCKRCGKVFFRLPSKATTFCSQRCYRPPFWDLVDKLSSPNGCWLWTGPCDQRGYGRYYVGLGKGQYAHRLSYELVNGMKPGVMDVCHHCDTPLCVNPAHLFLGTHQDNMADMVAKGRSTLNRQLGDAHYLAKLDPDKVRHMRYLYSQGLSPFKIARIYGVDPATARSVVLRKSWKHVA